MAARRRPATWRNRLLAAALVIALVLVAGLAFGTYRSYRETAKELVLESNREAAFLSAIRLRDELTRFSADLMETARTKDMSLGLATRQRVALRNNAARLAIFDGGVVLLDGFGRVRAAEPPRPEIMGTDWSDREIFRALLTSNEPKFATVSGVGPAGANVVVVSVPVLGESRELVGVLVGMFQLGESTSNSFYASIVRLRIEATGNVYVTDDAGRILFDSAFERVGQFVTLPWDSSADSRGGSVLTTDPDGNHIILAYAPIPGTSWSLLVENDWGIESQPIRRYAGGLAALLAVGLVLPTAGLIAVLRGRRNEVRGVERVAEEVRLAELMRERLLPRQLPLLSGYNLAVRTLEPGGGRTSGDFYDLMLMRDGRLVVTLGSVAEQGVLATHVMATARAGFRAAACKNAAPAQALGQCNLLLCPEVDADSTVASTYALLDPSTGRVILAIAGQPAPFRWRESTLSELPVTGRSALLGRELDARYSQDELTLAPGEALVFFTRGITELRSATGEPFVLNGLRLAPAEDADEADSLAETLDQAISSFSAEPGRATDVTLLVLARERQPVHKELPARGAQPDFYALAGTETDL